MYKSDMADPVLIAFPLRLPVGWSAPAHHHPHPELLLVGLNPRKRTPYVSLPGARMYVRRPRRKGARRGGRARRR
jgi:hypothetical protein